jgi:hypothetical protein
MPLLNRFGPYSDICMSLLILTYIKHTMHGMGVHDIVLHDVGMHDMSVHDIAVHYVAVHDVGVPGVAVHKM